MGELLKAILTETSNSKRPKVYTVETGLVNTSAIINVSQDVIMTVQSDTIFLCQSIGFLNSFYQGGASNQYRSTMPITNPVTIQVVDPNTRQRYFSGRVPMANFQPSLNDRNDNAFAYWLLGGTQQLQVSFLSQIAGSSLINFSAMFYGVEYRFNVMPDLSVLKSLALTYNPPQKDQARHFALDPMIGVIGSTSANITNNIGSTSAQIAAVQQELSRVNNAGQSLESTRYSRYLTHHLANLKASVRNASATTS